MKLTVEGFSPVLCHNEIYYLIWWVGKLLLGRCAHYVTIAVKLTEIEGYRGDVEVKDELHRPREFVIRLDPTLKWRSTQIKTLFHEMVHVEQWVTGKMRDYESPLFTGTRWKKRIFAKGDVSYYDSPWEKEAFRKEKSLYQRYVRHLKKEGISFDDDEEEW